MPTLLNRREFLIGGLAAASATMAGCAVNPVTGQQQLMLMSRDQEIDIDKQNAPHQFSADYGADDDPQIQNYITKVGKGLAAQTHRPDMPYNFRVVNATYVNAYAFPGGSIAATRGIMLTLQDEAELAALLGHELGHVNARHTASRMSKALLIQGLAAGLTLGVQSSEYDSLTPLAAGLGAVASGALLAHYSREDERQADALGMEYMVASGYSPEGMVGLQQHLVDMHTSQPSAMEVIFASHPMSEERRDTAKFEAETDYASALKQPLYHERYMDNTANLRKIAPAIKAMQDGEKSMGQKKYDQAEQHFTTALDLAPGDYAGLLMMSKCQLALGHKIEADRYAELAKQSKPGEPQALHVSGMAKLERGKQTEALREFKAYEHALPGNNNNTYLQALCYDGMGQTRNAAALYKQFINNGGAGSMGKHAYGRLTDMGFIKQ